VVNLRKQVDLPKVHAPLVYYARIRDLVKIGTTTQFQARMSALDVDEVLAVEPGGRELEQVRHAEFRPWYVRNELFSPSDVLEAHIARLREVHDVPSYRRPVRQPRSLAVPLKWGHGIAVTIPASAPREVSKLVLKTLRELELLRNVDRSEGAVRGDSVA
jgi:hypothetical protein